jgi:hypothetical protein
MSGDLKIIDMHMDTTGLGNLMRIIDGKEGRYKSISVLAKADRLSSDFDLVFKDFKNELASKGVTFELRIMSDKDALEQHERLLMDDKIAYKIPPLNIINKKSEHLVGVNSMHAQTRFNKLWSNAGKYENLEKA